MIMYDVGSDIYDSIVLFIVQVSLKSVTVLVISLLIFLVICVLIYSQTLSAEKELDLAENPVDSLDIIMAGEN